jgi:predicted Zn-dependent protease
MRATLLGPLLIGIAVSATSNPVRASDHDQEVLPPPYEGIYQPQGVDEIGIWRQDDERERQLAASPLLIRDEKLTAYVKSVLCETVGQDRCNAVRVYIIREPTFNASMSPNGTLRVLSGLFLRVRNEAELGAVLGHEFGHFEKRHTLDEFRSRRSGSDLLAWSALLVSLSPTYTGIRSYQNLQLSVYGNLFRHSRDQEREADRLGIAYLNRSRLRPQAAASVWRTVIGEAEASAHARGLKKPDFKAIAFTASHPPDGERAQYLAELAAPDADDRDDGAQRYREALAPWLPIFLDDQIKLNDFGGSDYLIQNLAETGWTASLWYARGELYRTRGSQRDFVNAAQFYRNAIAIDPTLANAYRGLGLALIKTGNNTEGQAALAHYLQLSPDAPDAKMIGLMVPEETGQ